MFSWQIVNISAKPGVGNFEQIMIRFFSLLSNLAAIFRNIYDIIINLYSFLARFSPPFLEIHVYFIQYYRNL